MGYVSKVFELVNLSPGKFYSKHSARTDRKRKYVREYKSSLQYKRRRLQFKHENSSQQIASEIREGKTYLTGVDLDGATDAGIEEIPAPVPAPLYSQLNAISVTQVFFDLETTSMKKTCDIVQVAAVYGNNCYTRYAVSGNWQ